MNGLDQSNVYLTVENYFTIYVRELGRWVFMCECVNWDGRFNGRLGGFLVREINMEEILILVGNR